MSLQDSPEQSDEPNRADTDAEKIVIKKYSNRRLYNTATSKYIVLADVIDLVNAGQEFIIEDAKSGDDITRSILNQIIFEQETRPQEFLFPLEFQKQLIRLYDDSYGQLIPAYLTQSIQYFTQERSKMAGAWQDMMTQNTEQFVKQSQMMAKQNLEMFQKSWDFFGMMPQTPEKPETKKTEQTAEQETVFDDLQSQINALQAQLKAMKE